MDDNEESEVDLEAVRVLQPMQAAQSRAAMLDTLLIMVDALLLLFILESDVLTVNGI